MKDYFNHSFTEIPYIGQSLYLLNVLSISTTLPTSIPDSLLPLFLLTFIGPLIANTYYKYFTLNLDHLILFLFALILGSLKLSRVVFNRYVRMALSIVSKTLLVIDVRNNKDDVAFYVVWILINSIVGMGIAKIVGKQQLRINDGELMEIFGLVSVMCLARRFFLHEFVIFGIMVVLVFFCNDNVKDFVEQKLIGDEEKNDGKESEEKTGKRGRGRPKKDERSMSVECPTETASKKAAATPRRKAARKLSFDEE